MAGSKFNLRELLIATVIVALGAWMIAEVQHGMSALSEARKLQSNGVRYGFGGAETPAFWSTPDRAEIVISHRKGKYALGDSFYEREEAVALGKSLKKRLRALGVSRIDIIVSYEDDKARHETSVASFDELP